MSQITDYRPKGEDEKPVLVDVRGCLTGRKLSGKGFITGDCEDNYSMRANSLAVYLLVRSGRARRENN